ncbi:MAG: hypothetical protein Q8M28_07355 [Methylobacter sp.]|nr:hypothetical protein [Methylobacter sp.]
MTSSFKLGIQRFQKPNKQFFPISQGEHHIYFERLSFRLMLGEKTAELQTFQVLKTWNALKDKSFIFLRGIAAADCKNRKPGRLKYKARGFLM